SVVFEMYWSAGVTDTQRLTVDDTQRFILRNIKNHGLRYISG
ncbi:jg19860, partial [Pararge aegeria aegeria]